MRSCGIAVCPFSIATISLPAGTSVRWVSVHVASAAIVASYRTAESVSPHRRMPSWVSSH